MIAPIINNLANINVLSCKNTSFQRKPVSFGSISSLKDDVFEKNDEDFNKIKNSIRKENYIGGGFEGKVFKIDDSDLVVKIPKSFFNKFSFKANEELLKMDFNEVEVTKQDEFNHIVKKYQNGVSIMKKIDGSPAVNDENIYKVANLPVSEYKNLLNTIIDAHNNDMEFDFATNNILYDNKNKKLTPIDFRPYKDDKASSNFNPLEKMYFAFDCYKQPYEKIIASKILMAGLLSLKPNEEQRLPAYKYDFKKVTRILAYNNPNDFTALSMIDYNINNVINEKLYAETYYEESILNNYIDNTINMIDKYSKSQSILIH